MSGKQPAMGTQGDALSDRVVAYLIDFSLLSVVAFVFWLASFVLTLVVGIGGGALGSDSGAAAAGIGALIIPLLLWGAIGVAVFGYFAYLDGSTDGTLGKRFMDVAVVQTDGSDATIREAAIRTVVLMLPFPVMALLGGILGAFGFVFALGIMGVWLLIEAAVMFVSDDGKRIGDRLAGTLVVQRTEDAASATRDPAGATASGAAGTADHRGVDD